MDENFMRDFFGLRPKHDKTLRDEFAAAALTGIIGRRWEGSDGKVPADIFDQWAGAAYAAADAMLKRRSHSAGD